MKFLSRIIFLLVISMVSLCPSYSQTVKAMTFNIRLDTPVDEENMWDYRKVELLKLIDFYSPDFLGLQEVLHNQLVYINSGLNNYSYIGVGREDGNEKGEYSPIFYNSLRFELINHHTFWLSEHIDSVSVGWDAALERICTYGLFKEKKSGELIHVFNTHFDHVGKIALVESAKLILRKIEECASPNSKVILMGDFNCEPESEPIRIIKSKLACGAETSPKGIYGPVGTYNGFDRSIDVNRRIDYIFVKNLNVINYRHVDDRMKNNNFISDHFPVLVEMLNQ